MKSRRVALLVSGVESRDAVGNDVVEMFAALQQLPGWEARIFAPHCRVEGIPFSQPSELKAYCDEQETLIVYHHCIGWDLGTRMFLSCPGKRILRYHNITPSEFYAPYSAVDAHVCHAGREEVRRIASVDGLLMLCDSEYNLDELVSFGACRDLGRVLAPLHRIDSEWFGMGKAVRERQGVIKLSESDQLKLLFVGRVAPQKSHDFLIELSYVIRMKLGISVQMTFVGSRSPNTPRYNSYLDRKVRHLGVTDSVHWKSHVTHDELKSEFLSSHAFVLASHHEGFCVPVIESLGAALPLYALASSAVPATMGDQGVTFDSLNPVEWATQLQADFYVRGVERPDPSVIEHRFGLPRLRADLTRCLEELASLPSGAVSESNKAADFSSCFAP